MKNQLSRLVLIAAAIILSFYFLWPTYQDYRFRQEISQKQGQDSLTYIEQNQDQILQAKLKRIKLGLDLQGGMRVVLEVDVLQLLDDLARDKDDNFKSIMSEVRKEAASSEINILETFSGKFQIREIRMSRYYGNIRDDDKTTIGNLGNETEKAIDRAVEIVRNRIDQ